MNFNPELVFNQMMQNNPQFKKFVEENKGKSIEEIAQKYKIDLNLIKSLMK